MNFTELAKSRYSCRKYQTKEVSKELIEQLIEAVRLTPSACNSQPWKFVVCQKEMAEKMVNCIVNPLMPFNKWVKTADTFIVVCETKAKLITNLPVTSQKFAQMDVGMATITLCYKASELGLGTCIIGDFNAKQVKELLAVPKDVEVRLIISLGYPIDGTIPNKSRKEHSAIFSYEKY